LKVEHELADLSGCTDDWIQRSESGAAAPQIGDRIVTLEDSITQAGGYQAVMKKVFDRFYPQLTVEIVNAGISGHKSPDMSARLQRDVIDKKPTIVTVSCGVNDVWHGFYTPPREVDLETYTRLMQQMVRELKEKTEALAGFQPAKSGFRRNGSRTGSSPARIQR
jgi:lysophospholipase L1-like esterase